jgi:hypothetical protein
MRDSTRGDSLPGTETLAGDGMWRDLDTMNRDDVPLAGNVKLVRRPITSPGAIEYAQRLLNLGAGDIELDATGRMWATGIDRRTRPR